MPKTTWNQHMLSVYKKNKKENKDYKLGDAMKDAKKTWSKVKGGVSNEEIGEELVDLAGKVEEVKKEKIGNSEEEPEEEPEEETEEVSEQPMEETKEENIDNTPTGGKRKVSKKKGGFEPNGNSIYGLSPAKVDTATTSTPRATGGKSKKRNSRKTSKTRKNKSQKRSQKK